MSYLIAHDCSNAIKVHRRAMPLQQLPHSYGNVVTDTSSQSLYIETRFAASVAAVTSA